VPWQAVALSDTTICADAGKLTLSVPHSTWGGPGRSGPDAYISHRPALGPEATIRGAAGAVTVRVLVSVCGPVSSTSRLVREPAGTGTRIVPPPADQRPPACSETASRLWVRSCRPAGPAEDVTWIVTVFEAGEKAHPRRSGTGAGSDRPRQLATSATTDSNTTASTARRNRICREVGRG
jgi:hypothetical protein